RFGVRPARVQKDAGDFAYRIDWRVPAGWTTDDLEKFEDALAEARDGQQPDGPPLGGGGVPWGRERDARAAPGGGPGRAEAHVCHGNDVVMPWGKYAGRPVRTLPCRYLAWLKEHKLCTDLRRAALAELIRRRGGCPALPPDAEGRGRRRHALVNEEGRPGWH